jgi:hypothetical protein
MILTKSNPPPLKTYIRVGWDIDQKITKGSSPYLAVNLRKRGLKSIKCKTHKKVLKYSTTNQWIEIIDLRIESFDLLYGKITIEWWENFYEVVDKKKFFIARLELGF